ncbi:TOX high mobility group box family member 4-B isoform X1 [Lucilia cuprina]|uniref:TOX high mobility group box family member 4-B isoform X1 n=1 Tax=Lucilia cuprina TaxID=7375 RepID=UPI001F06B2E2|nr:TOX high mobility group box family member 4-B isoform X1 [Lucilia cuprina]
MNTQFHTPSFGDELFDMGDASSNSTPTANFLGGHGVNTATYMYQQQQHTPTTTKRMISLHNTSDEYHTANEESFNVTANNSMNNSVLQTNINNLNNVLPGGTTGGGGGVVTPSPTTGPTTMAARKQMVPSDQNEPAKPLSAYALFFRDTVSAIKQQNPSCSFQELSKIVASMWDALDPAHKNVYNKKNETAKIEYLKQMRVYQQQQQLKQEQLTANVNETVQTEANVQQQTTTTVQQMTPTPAVVNNLNNQQNTEVINNNNTAVTATNATANSGAPSEEQMRLLTEAGAVQKCTRENCNKRAIINPDWEDEYCSNECVVIHCRNVFNAWVQSNLEAKQQQQQQQQQQTTTPQTTTT